LKEPFARFVENEMGTGFLLIVCGLPGTWKTETTEEVAKIKGYPLLRTDLIRLEVLKNEDIFDEKVASNMNKRTLVYDEMFTRAEEILKRGDGHSVAKETRRCRSRQTQPDLHHHADRLPPGSVYREDTEAHQRKL